MVPNHAPRVYATVTAHVNRDLKDTHGSVYLDGEGFSALRIHNNNNNNPRVCCNSGLLLILEDSKQLEEEEEEAERLKGIVSKGNKSVTVRGNSRPMDPFLGLLFIPFVSIFFFKSYLCELFCLL